jgi:hypothetical protein
MNRRRQWSRVLGRTVTVAAAVVVSTTAVAQVQRSPRDESADPRTHSLDLFVSRWPDQGVTSLEARADNANRTTTPFAFEGMLVANGQPLEPERELFARFLRRVVPSNADGQLLFETVHEGVRTPVTLDPPPELGGVTANVSLGRTGWEIEVRYTPVEIGSGLWASADVSQQSVQASFFPISHGHVVQEDAEGAGRFVFRRTYPPRSETGEASPGELRPGKATVTVWRGRTLEPAAFSPWRGAVIRNSTARSVQIEVPPPPPTAEPATEPMSFEPLWKKYAGLRVVAMAVSPNGERVALTGHRPDTPSREDVTPVTALLDARTGRLMGELPVGGASVVYSADGSRLYSGSFESVLTTIDSDRMEVTRTDYLAVVGCNTSRTRFVKATESPDELVLGSDRGVFVWNLREHRIQTTWPPERWPHHASESTEPFVAGQQIVIHDGEGKLLVWNRQANEVSALEVDGSPIDAVAACSLMGEVVLVPRTDRGWGRRFAPEQLLSVRLRETGNPVTYEMESRPIAVTISQDGTLLATGDAGGRIRLRSSAVSDDWSSDAGSDHRPIVAIAMSEPNADRSVLVVALSSDQQVKAVRVQPGKDGVRKQHDRFP